MEKQSKSGSASAFSIVIIFVLLLCIGAALIPQLPIRLLPSYNYASLTLYTTLRGASTEVTELEVTSPLEATLSRLKGIANISSISDNGQSRIKVQLDKWTDPDMFRFEVSSLIRQIYPLLPEHTTYPQISLNQPEENIRNQPILSFTLSGDRNLNDIADFAEQEIRPLFSNVKGLHRLMISGARPIYHVIDPNVEKMRYTGLSISGLREQLLQGFKNMELGKIRLAEEQPVVFLNKSIHNSKDLMDWPIVNGGGRIFKLSDIASISEATPKSNILFRINGNEQVSLLFYAEENVNSIRLAEIIKQKLDHFLRINKDDYHIQLQFDQTEFIKDELNKIYLRTGLSVVILLLFVTVITRKLRYVAIVVVALVANILLSIICYYLFQVNIHLYSLAGITISLGLVIDNVIVIVDDIRHTGRNRIFAAILASTFTALGALSIVFLLEESQKLQLIDFAIAVIINLVVSLPIAYFFIPALLDLLPIQTHQKKHLYNRRRKLVRFSRLYTKQLTFMLRYKWWFIVLFVLTFGVPIYLLPTKIQGEDNIWKKAYNQTFGNSFYNQNLRENLNKYLGGILYQYILREHSYTNQQKDSEEQTQLIVEITMPIGAQIEQIDAVCREFEELLDHYKPYITVFTTNIFDPTSAHIRIIFNKEIPLLIPYQVKNLLERQSILSGSADFAVYGVGTGFDNALNIDRFDAAIVIKGYNYQQLQALAMIVRDSLLQYQRVDDIMISSQREWGQTENFEHTIRFTNPEYLTLNKIGRWSMGNVLNQMEERSTSLGTFESPQMNTSSSVHLFYNYENTPTIWYTKHMPLHVNDSTAVKLSNISEITKVRVGRQMIRENQEYVLYINYRFIGTYQLNSILNERVVESISSMLPFGYKIESTSLKKWSAGSLNYLWFIPLVLLIIYMICAILLESLVQPISIIAMIPFSFIGVFLTFQMLGLHFDQGGYAALLMLSGLVTNAALYILNDYNFIKNKQESSIRRYIKAYNLKAMPILITTASAILSLLPFMIAGTEKGFWFTLSAGTIGGLLFSLLGVYLLLPLLLISKNIKSNADD